MMTKKRRAKSQSARSAPAPKTAPLWRRARAWFVGIAPIIALMSVVRIALAEPYYTPSGSLSPTLLEGDRLYVNKLRYGPHIPFTNINLPGYAEPKRRDVVVFVSPPQNIAIRITPDDVTPMLVKRIVGVAGDTLHMRSGLLYVNGVPETQMPPGVAEQSMSPELFAWQHSIAVTGTRFGEPPAAPSLHMWGPLVVPRDSYFMLGDNRDASVDSRFYGPVPRRNIRGRPIFIYHSYDTQKGRDYLRAVTEIRWRRLATLIR
jgi:signal peptidase I